MNILYVENHSIFATNAVRQFLSSHKVTIVPSLAAAREALVSKPFEVVLIDYDLDDGKGDELAREIGSRPGRMVVIGVSSHDDGNASLLRAGASAVCSKAEFDRIQDVIDGVVNRWPH
jgi:DNA-binding NarL/FixJ family response regulator